MDRCPYCRSQFGLKPEIVACSDCGSRYHNDCWESNNGCSVFGCSGRLMSLSDGGISCVYSSPLLPSVQNIKNLLELNGISSGITNQYLSAEFVGLSPMESWPELWVPNDEAARAKQIINALLANEALSKDSWSCPKCNEQLQGQFTECWNCGTSRS